MRPDADLFRSIVSNSRTAKRRREDESVGPRQSDERAPRHRLRPSFAPAREDGPDDAEEVQRLGIDGAMKQRERVRAQQHHRRSSGRVVAEIVTCELEQQHQRGEKGDVEMTTPA